MNRRDFMKALSAVAAVPLALLGPRQPNATRAPTVGRMNVRTGLPTVQWREFNQGVSASGRHFQGLSPRYKTTIRKTEKLG
jgi:hypothetical protein